MTTTGPAATAVATLHPQAAAHLAATAGSPGVAAMTVAEARVATLGYLQLQRPAVEVAHVQHRYLPGPTADLPIRILRPALSTHPRPAIVVLHGSGWVACNLDVVDEPARVLAVDTGFIVITVNYQKAPEHRFPIPLADCIATVPLGARKCRRPRHRPHADRGRRRQRRRQPRRGRDRPTRG